MIASPQVNVPALLGHYEEITTVYLKQYGPGNLRIGHDKDSLLATTGLPTQDGIVQVTADGWKQYFWQGDLWVITDAAGQLVFEAPSYSFFVDRLKHGVSPNTSMEIESEIEGNLSTY